jgi:hypothetical protein
LGDPGDTGRAQNAVAEQFIKNLTGGVGANAKMPC